MRTLLIGLGNRFRRDDGAALKLINQLKHKKFEAVETLSFEGDPVDLIERWHGFQRVILVDATASGAAPGTISRFDVGAKSLPERLFSRHSTHLLGLADAIELARQLQKLPPEVLVLGIEGSDFSFGEGLSGGVEAALQQLERQLEAELAQSEAGGNSEAPRRA